jgi:hypothetical protein
MMFVRPFHGVRALALAAACAAVLSGCQDLLVEPAARATGGLAFVLQPAATSAGDAEAFDAADEARIHVTGAGGDVLIDDVFTLPEPGERRMVAVEVPLEADAETLQVEASLLFSGEPVFEGTSSVRLERGQTATASITLAPVAAGIEVAPPAGPITAIGNTLALDGAAMFATGDPVEGVSLDWESLDPDVATVSLQGVVTAHAEGEARIVASYLGHQTTVVVHVDPVATTIVVDATLLEVAVDDARTITAVVYDANGNVLNRRPTWQTSAPGVATVDDNGVVRGVAEGQATITATAGGLSLDVDVTVLPSLVGIWDLVEVNGQPLPVTFEYPQDDPNCPVYVRMIYSTLTVLSSTEAVSQWERHWYYECMEGREDPYDVETYEEHITYVRNGNVVTVPGEADAVIVIEGDRFTVTDTDMEFGGTRTEVYQRRATTAPPSLP